MLIDFTQYSQSSIFCLKYSIGVFTNILISTVSSKFWEKLLTVKVQLSSFSKHRMFFQIVNACSGPCYAGHHALHCGKVMALKVTNDNKDQCVWRCRKIHKSTKGQQIKVCKDVKLSIRHQSWLVDAKIPLETVVELIYLWAQGFTLQEILHELKLSKRTIIEWSAFFRDTCLTTLLEYSEAIGGQGVEVEIDESKFGKRKYHKGHRVEGQWVFGGREKKDKSKIFMVPVANQKGHSITIN